MSRVGFCCKFIDDDSQVGSIPANASCRQYNASTTTLSWLRRQSRELADEKLYNLGLENIKSVERLVSKVAEMPEHLRMVRISSDILPMYTEPTYKDIWQQSSVQSTLTAMFSKIGDIARAADVRLSFHPGQFVVLASDSEDIVRRSISEFEYHADMARMMGYGKTFQDFKINVHIAGRTGPDGIRAAYSKLSDEAKRCITIENEENAWGLDSCLELADILPIVFDIHHHHIYSGEYLRPDDERIKRVVESWRGVRPAMHYSVSKEDLLVGHCPNTLPNKAALIEAGINKQKLRAHSNYYWNKAANRLIKEYLDIFDVQCESKGKNLASHALARELGVI